MRILVALLLALLMACAAYAGFWWFSLTYNAAEMRGSVEEALGGQLTYGDPEWVPELLAVRVRWPEAHLQMLNGPVREITASHLMMVSGFLSRDRWTLELPDEIQVRLASGNMLKVKTKKGGIVLLEAPSRLAFRADEMTVLNAAGQVLVHVNDVMAERSPTDEGGVKLNLASRPDWGAGQAVLSGQLVLPTPVAGAVLETFGGRGVPRFSDVVQVMVQSLMATGGTAGLDNISFRVGDVSGAVFGTLQVTADGYYAGSLAVTADSPARLMEWLNRTGVVAPRNMPERIGWLDVQDKIKQGNTALRVEVMPGGLLLNGAAVGPLPKVMDVVRKLWP